MRSLAIAAAAALGLSLIAVGGADAKRRGSCVLAGGQGTGIEIGVARYMAGQALAQSIAKGKLKARGKVSYNCTNQLIMQNCTATQRACK